MQHDPKLVLLAVGVAAAASFVTFIVFSHLLVRSSGRHGAWLFLAALCAGSGIWAAHVCVALAAFPDLRGYSPLFAGLSFASAVACAAGGIAVAARAGRQNAVMGGAIIGCGIALTHALGLAAFESAATAPIDSVNAIRAALFGIVLSATATLAFREYLGRVAIGLGTILMTAAISAALITGTAAIDIAPDRAPEAANDAVLTLLFALAAAGGAAAILIVGYIAALLDRRAMRAIFARLDQLIDVLMEGVVIAESGRIIGVNARLLEMTGRAQKDLIGCHVFGDLLSTKPPQRAPGAPVKFDAEMRIAGGKPMLVEIFRRPLHVLGRASEVFAIRDLCDQMEAANRIAYLANELKQTQQDLRRRNFLLEGVLANMSQGICMFDVDQRVVLSNDRYAALYGLAPEIVKPGTHLRDIIQKRIDKGLYSGASPKAYMDARLALPEKAGQLVEELSDQRLIQVNRRLMPGGGWVTTHEDITEKRRIEAQNLHLSEHDALTDLPNRDLLHKLIGDALAEAPKAQRRHVLLIVDLDHFRDVNNTLGHGNGDTVLKQAAERLRSHTRKSTILGRFGDDEFVLVEAVDQPARDAAALAGRIHEQLRQPFKLDGKDVFVESTIGIAIAPGDGADAASLLKSAAVALHRAKIDSRATYRFFEPAMDRELKERLALEQELAEALSKNQFELHYQPLVSLARNEISGFEALLRWRSQSRGLVAPAQFLAVAEGAGLLPPIEEWTLRQACGEAAKWPEPLKVAINISQARFKAQDFVRSVLSALASSGLNAQRLEIEISEKVIQSDPEVALTTMRQLSDLGVRIALDDFGTGFASLGYLRRFPIQRVKVDKIYVSSLAQEAQSQVILRTLARLGAGFGVATTAEGVETQEQFEVVRSEGFTEMQGFYFSAPRTADEIRALFLTKSDSAVA